MKRTLAMVGLAAVLTCGFDASAAPSAELRERITVMLGDLESVATEAEWKRLGPDAPQVLREIALDEKVTVLKRGRAATALGFFKTDANKRALTQLVQNDKNYWLLRGKAARSFANGWGAESLTIIQPLLNHQNKRLRAATVRAMASVPTVQSRQILSARLDKEPNTHVRTIIQAAVRHIDKIRGTR